jgi:Transposase DDE domain
MFIAKNKVRHSSGKVYESVLLRESYREGNKVKKRTIANLSHCNEDEIRAIQFALKNKSKLAPSSMQDFNLIQGRSIGSVFVLNEIAKQLGIIEALGSGFHAKLAMWLIIARIIEQGSRLSATRLDNQYDIASVIGLERGFDENNLYDCLHWLNENQRKIEDFLFNKNKQSQKFYWYDVTSSYFEGIYNELAAFGYNRDKKKRKRILVVGLLCQQNGDPVSIEGFKGNTQDTCTFESQIKKLKERFGCESITMVCDRGLIREKQKQLLNEHGYHYITALPMPQILSLINAGVIELKNFTADLKSFTLNERRYIYRCNPDRALETRKQRQERFETAQRKVDQENSRLDKLLNASRYAARKRINKILKTLCVFEWVKVNIVKKRLVLSIDEEKLNKKSETDGCYIWTTDLSEKEATDKEIYERYKDLKYIEDDFRTFKTTFLEIRPIFVRSEESTRGHLLVVMLAHMLLRSLRERWLHFNKTVEEGLNELSFLCRNTIQFSNGVKIECIPSPNEGMNALLKAIGIVMPKTIEETKVPVVTRQKVRKSATF